MSFTLNSTWLHRISYELQLKCSLTFIKCTLFLLKWRKKKTLLLQNVPCKKVRKLRLLDTLNQTAANVFFLISNIPIFALFCLKSLFQKTTKKYALVTLLFLRDKSKINIKFKFIQVNTSHFVHLKISKHCTLCNMEIYNNLNDFRAGERVCVGVRLSV